MKKIICYLDEANGIIYQDFGGTFMLGSKSHTLELIEADNKSSSQDIAVQLATSGMSAEDIVKLKHGGVI